MGYNSNCLETKLPIPGPLLIHVRGIYREFSLFQPWVFLKLPNNLAPKAQFKYSMNILNEGLIQLDKFSCDFIAEIIE